MEHTRFLGTGREAKKSILFIPSWSLHSGIGVGWLLQDDGKK